MNHDNKKSILIADDERHTRDALERFFRRKYEVTTAEDGERAINLLKRNHYDLLLTDLNMPNADGMAVIDAALKKSPPPPCIVFTAYGSVENAIAAIKRGATDFVTKPINLEQLDHTVNKTLETQTLKAENQRLKKRLNSNFEIEHIVAKSPQMRAIMDMVTQIAKTRSTVMITGESGTGKEVIARAIHKLSERDGAFIPVNCAALPATLLESELFGHERGSFTGALEQKKGRFELADGGTLFLDEIGEIDQLVQVKLLRVLETRTFERVGGEEPIFTDTRLISATNRDLKFLVEEGKFREDLFYRLDVININMPPLRDRLEDIPILVKRFIDEFAEFNNKHIESISHSALDTICAYSWPGNIRELRNCIEQMVVLAQKPVLELENVPSNVRNQQAIISHGQGMQTSLNLDNHEKLLVMAALRECNGNRTHAAAKLGISRRTLIRKIKEFNLS
ncbi:MAG: sigma-54 dependent transcriptional regulator [Victivallaceae bacterium]|nr:sigma-54 dependent transcriptional regulator [Victivallaceae bacterium]